VLRPGFFKIADPWILWAVIDCAINSGPVEATTQLQRALNVQVDGIFGPQTTMAVNATNPERLFRRVLASRVRHYGQIIRKDHTQAVFAGGWFDRVASILEAA
jgi:lysozyme family protein